MRLLFLTLVMDMHDSVLGAYHGLVKELAARMETITVICLYEGEHQLPENVKVYSLGKERKVVSAFMYVVRFKWLAWKLRHEYDRVFVHMNQEYILIAGPMWKLLGKPIYMWRNHYAGSWLTDFAATFCTKVFCTSKHSYTAKYKKTVLMPVGVDLSRFSPEGPEVREPRSILFLARISPSKRVDMFIEALGLLIGKGVSFVASVYGSPLPEDERYYETLKQRVEELGLHGRVRFHAAVPNKDTPGVYRSHEIFVNCSQSGMFDKTLFEAAASGCKVFAVSDDFADLAGQEYHFQTAEDLASRFEQALTMPDDPARIAAFSSSLARQESLATLADCLTSEMIV
jgi:glycosyltransferase involved in cell wall biosynthesis